MNAEKTGQIVYATEDLRGEEVIGHQRRLHNEDNFTQASKGR